MDKHQPNRPALRETGLVQRMRRSVQALPKANPHILLACSGGKDSVALAQLLSEMNRLGLLTFLLGHVHHNQHENADAAVRAVQRIGLDLDVKTDVVWLSTKSIDRHKGVGLEEALRRERYLALAAMARNANADYIALAHHRNDQAETILLHLLRGAGVDGLAGMRSLETRTIPWWEESDSSNEIGLWRPLLSESVESIEELATKSGLPIVEDPTNTDSVYRRNAIRNELIPLAERIAPGSVEAIARSADVIASDVELLKHTTATALDECRSATGLSRKSLMDLRPNLQSRVIHLWLRDSLPTADLSTDRIEAVRVLAERNRGDASIEIGGGHTVRLLNGHLSVD